jgi:hypothetical protein
MINRNLKSIALASSAAALFLLGGCANQQANSTTTASAEGHCTGVNACKGHSDCKTATNECAGKNACKGQGFVTLVKPVCEQVGGTFQAG